MSNEGRGVATHEHVDPERDRSGQPFDDLSGASGQEYSREREAIEGTRRPSGHPLTGDPSVADDGSRKTSGRDIPPDAGRRASFDGRTGEVHGSGSGGEDEEFDAGTPGA